MRLLPETVPQFATADVQGAYPHFYREFCVFLALTEGRGQGDGHIVCVFEETGERVFETRKRPIPFGPDPLEVVGVPFRIRDCSFPRPGRYSVQFWDDFVCDAIHDPAIPMAKPENQRKDEGMSVVEELVFDASGECKSDAKEGDSPRRAVTISNVAWPLGSGWGRLFHGAAAAAAFGGLVGGVLRTFGAIAGIKDARDAAKGCQLCGCSDAAYSLHCCHSVACQSC
jgi:hypothetical protein